MAFHWFQMLDRVRPVLPRPSSPAVDSELFTTLHEAVHGEPAEAPREQ